MIARPFWWLRDSYYCIAVDVAVNFRWLCCVRWCFALCGCCAALFVSSARFILLW